jgi:hypothetical protein
MIAPAFAANEQGVTLHPSGFGPHSYAAWKAHEGEADSNGGAAHALYLQKQTSTTTVAAGVAVFQNIGAANLDAGGLRLAFDVRNDGYCGAGAPRFNVTLDNGTTLFIGCQAMSSSPGKEPNWTHRSTTLPDATPGKVASLAIVFDEGTDLGSGRTWLDEIQVDDMKWSGPSDNGH